MQGRTATTRLESCHKRWLSKAIGIPEQNYGIDLADDRIGVELKSRLRMHSRIHTVHDYQINEFRRDNPALVLYWAFMLYNLRKPVNQIENEELIEDLVVGRKVWFLRWDWIRQFPVSNTRTGAYRYANHANFSNGVYFNDFERTNGTLYVPKKSLLEKKLKGA